MAPAKKKRTASSRLRHLLEFDRSYHCRLPEVVIGLDEVGRGCLAGPVVAAAVKLPMIEPRTKLASRLARLNDSKLVPPAEREELAAIIQEVAEYGIGEASVEEINELNILQASLLAMKRARQALRAVSNAVLLIDGNQPIPGMADPQITVVKGDTQSACIAAASIVAKVHRDALMCRLSVFFPDYLWHQNKGYRSRAHWEAINRLGVTPWHRTAFVHVRDQIEIEDLEQIDFLEELEPSST